VDSDGNATSGVIATSANGHANDADNIVGDNGDIIRLVGINGTAVATPVGLGLLSGSLTQAGMPVQSFNGFLMFNYDTASYDSTAKIVVHAVRLLDYTPGGPDFDPVHQPLDIGSADEIHGESGNDTIYAQKGDDWVYGEGQDDDIIGGYGNDWISGGTGDDGIIGDDGRIYTSRNSLSAVQGTAGYLVSVGEPLNGIAPLLSQDADLKYSNGNALNEYIYTPGNMQTDTINISGALKKTVDLTPFSSDPTWNSADPAGDEFSKPADKASRGGYDSVTTQHYDDIIFGGLGSDWVHGGSGDDALSGAEALPVSYTQVEDSNHNVLGIAETDYAHPFNPSDALRFQSNDPDAKHPKLAGRTGEFALYDENDPLRIVLLNSDGTLDKATTIPGTGVVPAAARQFFLDFNQKEGVLHAAGISQQNGQQTVSYPAVYDDGTDVIYGDNGNDWIVGGTGRDHTYGGWGNDLLNADDNQTTAGGLNNIPETAPTYEDRAYGGAGKDVLIANTGGDRLIDWVGEYNSYLVPFSEFGMATVSRTLQPGLHFFLYAESLSDGVDATRFSDLNNGASAPAPKNNDPNPGRNGEPAGELGLVLQQDAAWHGQTGAPTDPQAGNTPGTQRDVLRSASFTGNGGPTGMFVADGTWSVSGASYANSLNTVSGDNVSLFDIDTWLPTYYEVSATVKVGYGGANQNSYIIFDYQSADNFKYAGIDVASGQIKIGQRTASGWTDVTTLKVKGLGLNKQTAFMLTANFRTATVSFNGYSLSYTFTAPLNTGMLGLGTNSSMTNFTSYSVQRLPFNPTYSVLEDFSDGVADNFTSQTGTWSTTSGTTGRYTGVAPANDVALTTRLLAVAPLSYVEYSATVNAAKAGVSAGVTFGYTSSDNFLYAGIIAGTNQVVLGHRSNGIWYVDAVTSTTITAGTNYTLLVALTEGSTNGVNVVLNGRSVLSFNYNYMVHDGSIGLYARNGSASFDNILIRGDDIAYAGGGAPLTVAAAPAQPALEAGNLDASVLSAALAEAERRWIASGLVDAAAITRLGAIEIRVADLDGLTLGLSNEQEKAIIIDANAVGFGWFIDPTPSVDGEFALRLNFDERAALPGSPSYGRIDLVTVVEHELGHLLGYEHGSIDLMNETLAAGARINPAPAQGDTTVSDGVTVSGVTPDASPMGPPSLSAAVSSTIDLSSLNIWSAFNLPGGIASPFGPGAESGKPATPPPAATSSSSGTDVATETNSTAKIDWNGNRAALMDKIASVNENRDWQGDFLNHLGKDGLQRNPNAGLKVRPGVFSA
jgi:hypothetical protein